MLSPDFPPTRGNPEYVNKIIFQEGVRTVSIPKYSGEHKVRTSCSQSMIICKQYN